MMKKQFGYALTGVLAAIMAFGSAPAMASSHREAPQTTEMPKIDNTDVYAFRSYAPGRESYTTLISNFQPFQEPGGGPNYFTMDPDAIYEIHIDNDGNAAEDITFQFRFFNTLRNNTGITVNVGGVNQPIALRHIGQVTQPDDPELGEEENYSVTMITGDRRTGTRTPITFPNSTIATFRKPFDNVGNKTIPDYNGYAGQFIHTIAIPGCAQPGRVFVGQRAEAFAVNIGPIFDLVNFVPIEGASAPGANDSGGFPGGIKQSDANQGLRGKYNITSLALEVPTACLTRANQPIIGVWSTASLPQARLRDPTPTYAAPALDGGAFVQVSRLGMPLVNELVIGLPQKDLFNAAEPPGDGALASYVTNPTFPAILDALFRAPVNQTLGTNFATLAPTNFPRNDLVATFLTGINTLNRPANVVASEMQRLNTSIAPTPREQQSPFGVAGDDLAGFPNGRRPGDDVVDIELRVAMGRLCHPVTINGTATDLGLCKPADAPTGTVAYTDGAPTNATTLRPDFPYLNTPLRGSPQPQISQN
jgi:hypothetical protein